MHYLEKQLKPEVEQEIKEGFFEIKKKYDESQEGNNTSKKGEDES